ncbi:MAG: hypothetical protein WA799_08750 [Nitrosotalea sp.]
MPSERGWAKITVVSIPSIIGIAVINGIITMPELIDVFLSVSLFAFSGALVYLFRSKSDKQNLVEKSASPILPEKREDYHNHLKQDIFETVTSNLLSITKEKNYFEALRKTNDKKRMILQHFRTIDLISQEYATLYAMYKVSVGGINDIEKRKKEVLKQIAEFDRKLQEYNSKNNDHTNWLNFEALQSAIGIKRNDPFESVIKNIPEYVFPSSINCNFYLVEKNNEFQLGFSNNWFARGKDKNQLEQLKNFLYENGYNIMQEVSSIHSSYHTIYSIGVSYFNKQFKEFDESLVGEPILGACISCSSWFNMDNHKKYKPILEEFNSNMSNYEESLWSNQTEF